MAINAALCQQANAQHGRTSARGYEQAEKVWESAHGKESLHFAEVLALGKECHRLSPFLFYNGNTFVVIVRRLSAELPLGGPGLAAVRQLAGHMVAGVLPVEEERRFLKRLHAR